VKVFFIYFFHFISKKKRRITVTIVTISVTSNLLLQRERESYRVNFGHIFSFKKEICMAERLGGIIGTILGIVLAAATLFIVYKLFLC